MRNRNSRGGVPNRTGGRAGRHGRNYGPNKNIIIGAVALIIVAVAIVVYLMLPQKHPITGAEDTVRRVINGNTIELSSGLKVQLLGVSPTQGSMTFLGELKDKRVRLLADSKDPNPYYKNPSKDIVKAYVTVVSPKVNYTAVNRYILSNVKDAEFLRDYCSDSLVAFNEIVAPNHDDGNGDDVNVDRNRKLLSEIELGKRMTPASFLIQVADNEGSGAIGTGFFINEFGLALTNYHVLEGASSFRALLSDEDGNITTDRNRKFGRILYADEDHDFVIFTVTLDNGEKVPYLPLTKQRPERGEKVGLVGNPKGLTATFSANGHVSAIREEAGLIQVDVSATHGDSGGPVCNFYGEVIGVLRGGIDNSGADLNFAVDIMTIREVLNSLKDVKTYGGK